ncbi:MAG: hypothetical protein HY817_05135 [Candidatus Abawacabacteria bacterium]|nr:hypothetical protein [Candidatus Abawacabacteria bacterium]
MSASEYIKTVSIADTVVQEVAGRSVVVTRSTMDQVQGDDIEMHQSIAKNVVSENDVLSYQSIVGTLQGRIVKTQRSFSVYTKAEVIESRSSISLVTSAETIQGTLYTVFTKTTAAIFAGTLLLGLYFLRKRSR